MCCRFDLFFQSPFHLIVRLVLDQFNQPISNLFSYLWIYIYPKDVF